MFKKRLDMMLKTCHQACFLRLSDSGATNYRATHKWSENSLEFRRNTEGKYLRACQNYRFMRQYSTLSELVISQPYNNEDIRDFRLSEREFDSTENGYLYSLVKKSNGNSIATITDEEYDEELCHTIENNLINTHGPAELVKYFRIISQQAKMMSEKPSEKHDRIFELLIHHHKAMTLEQLWNILGSLAKWCPIRKEDKYPGFLKLEKCFDNECIERMDDWTIDEILKTIDYWFLMRQIKSSQFVYKALQKLGCKPQKLNSKNYLQYMYYLNVIRKIGINMYELEYRLESIIDEFDAQELSVIALGFFKTATPIRNPALLRHIIKKAIDNIDTITDYGVSAVMKITRQSMNMREIRLFRDLMIAFGTKIESASPSCLVHAMHTSASTLIYEKEVIDKIVTRFIDHIPNSRLKDLERFLFSLMVFNYPPEHPIYEAIVDQLEDPAREIERLSYPKSFSSSLMFLSSIGIYPQKAINKVMQTDYLRKIYNNNSFFIGREYLTIETGLKIEVPEYQGPFLPDRTFNYLAKKYSSILHSSDPDSTKKVPSYQKFIFEVAHIIRNLIGPEYMRVDQIFPHYERLDIIFRIDQYNNFLPIGEELEKIPVGGIKYPPNDNDDRWVVLILACANQIFRETSELAGTCNSKLRFCRKIGYTPVIFPITEWKGLLTAPSKQKCVNDLLNRIKLSK